MEERTTGTYTEQARRLRASLQKLTEALPDAMPAFARLEATTIAHGALPAKSKVLIALAIGIAGRCDGCAAFYVQKALREGATREEILEAMGVAVLMGGGPAAVYAAHGLEALDEFSRATAPGGG
jgi:AhpD family alkylhydroperoxidase